MEDGLTAVGWSAPWLEPWRAPGEAVAQGILGGMQASAALNALRPTGVAFVPPDDLPAGRAYEQHVFETSRVPTREGLHDFFNGLCWLVFPRTKKRLNALQAACIARDGVGAARGPVRDAITLFDENGALLFAPEPLRQALMAQEWREAFITMRPLWRQAQVLLFGHALLEKLVNPRKDITAHVWHMGEPWRGVEELDGRLAAQLAPERLAEKPFTPLPVAGIPGWDGRNENFSFYDDSLVFRPRRASRTP